MKLVECTSADLYERQEYFVCCSAILVAHLIDCLLLNYSRGNESCFFIIYFYVILEFFRNICCFTESVYMAISYADART